MDRPVRKLNRLKNYDYSTNGAYFVTICTKDKKSLFWDVGADIIRPQNIIPLSAYGKTAEFAIKSISKHYYGITVDKYVIMPNHIHLILFISANNGQMISAPTLSIVIGQMKRYISKTIGFPIWQHSFYDHIIRNEQDYLKIWQYIDPNSTKWTEDRFYTI